MRLRILRYQDINMKDKKLIKIITLCILSFTFCFMVLSTEVGKAYAEAIDLNISPSLLQIQAAPPSDIRAPLTIENKSDTSVKLSVSFKPFKSSTKENGEIEFLKESESHPGLDKDFFNKVQLVDDDNFAIQSLELGPKQQKKLYLRIYIPKEEAFSDYYFSIVFMSIPQQNGQDDSNHEVNNYSTAQAGIALNVLLSIEKEEIPNGEIEKFTSPFYIESGPVPFTIQVTNKGNHFITPRGILLITNMFGQTIGKVEIPATNILANSSRYLVDSLQHTKANASTRLTKKETEQRPQTIWTETFLLGFYTATITIAFSDHGPIQTRSIHFLAFPLKFLLGLMIAIIMVIITSIRVKNKLKDK
jgi:hypothetical protein